LGLQRIEAAAARGKQAGQRFIRERPGRLFLASPAVAALQAIDGDNKAGPLEHFNQPIKDALVVVRARLQIFFENALSLAYGLNR
jgi:hypothetical protein